MISLKFVCSLEKGNFNSGENLKYLDVKTLRSEKEAKIIKSGYIVNPNEKVIIVDGENSGEIFTVSERGYMGSTMRLFVANKYINQEYLDIFLQTLKNTLRKNKKGSAIPHLNPGLFYSFMVPLPPIEEQERVANKVNVILKKLEEIKLINENITKLKDIIKTRIIHLGVNGKLLKSDDNYYSKNIKLKDCGQLLSGRDLELKFINNEKRGIPYITGASQISDNNNLIINRWTNYPTVISQLRDVLITVKGTIGKTAINNVGNIHIARQIMAFKSETYILPEYILLVFQNNVNSLNLANNSLIPGIKRDNLLNIKFPLFSIQKQREICSLNSKCFELLNTI